MYIAGMLRLKQTLTSPKCFPLLKRAAWIIPVLLLGCSSGPYLEDDEGGPRQDSSGLGAHLTWTLPFGLLIMFAVFNRFDKRFEEAARDLGASPFQTVRHVVLPIVLPSLVGVALFGFTLSYDELARSSQVMGALNTLPLELQAMQTNATTPVIYALGTLTTALSLAVIGTSLSVLWWLRARQASKGSDAGKGMV